MTFLRFLICLAAVVVWSGPAHGQWTVELDLDGTVGNGPDTVDVGVEDLIEANLWFHGTAGIYAFGFVICNPNGVLERKGVDFIIPEEWTINPGSWPPNCDHIEAIDLTFSNPIPSPSALATVHYRAAVDQTIAHIVLGDTGYIDTAFETGSFDNEGDTLAVVRIGETSTKKITWGGVKDSFR